MSTQERERKLAEAFVSLADTLVTDYDATDLLQSLVEYTVDLLDVSAAGLMLSDQRGRLQVIASSSEQTRLLELFQLQNDEGPCLECFRTGRPVAVPDLRDATDRWSQFVPAMQREGFAAVHALPLRLRDEVIGALNLFSRSPGDLPREDLLLAQALADVSTIGILQERAVHRGELLVEQLQGALNSRIVIEQAKGLLAEAGDLDMGQAFVQLRAYARDNRKRLSDVAADLVNGGLEATAIVTQNPHAPS